MKFLTYSHRFAEIIINSDYAIRQEVERIINEICVDYLKVKYKEDNKFLESKGKKREKGNADFFE